MMLHLLLVEKETSGDLGLRFSGCAARFLLIPLQISVQTSGVD